LVNLASLLQSLGADPAAVFREHGFDPQEFNDPDHRIPYLRGSHLLASCVEATGCEHLGLSLGQMAEPSHLGIAGFLLRAAPTVEVALHALVENLDLHDEGGTATLVVEPDYTTLGYSVHVPGVSAADQISDLSAAVMYKIMRALCGEDWAAATVQLVRCEPDDPTAYRDYFRTVLFFDSTDCSISFPSQCLQREPPAADELLYQHLDREAKMLHGLRQREFIEALPAVLTRGLLTKQFSARHIADLFGVNERTLHRRLKAAGTSFRGELDSARMSVGEQLLETTSLPVFDIANALGYADSSGFIRAFQRWCGSSPSKWRKHHSRLLPNQSRSENRQQSTP